MCSANKTGLIALVVMLSNVGIWAIQPGTTDILTPLLAEAQQAQARSDFISAAECYRRAVKVSPDTAELWADLGLMDHQIGQHSEAVRAFSEAARLNPSLFVPQLFLGIENLEIKHPEAAIPFLQKAEKLNPADLEAALTLGRAFAALGRGDRASDEYSKVVALAPNNGNAWLELGTSYLQQVDLDARTMTGTYKDSEYVKLRAGESFRDLGKLVQASSAYKTILSSTTAPPPCAHAGYGLVLLRQQSIPEAQAEFDLESRSQSGCPLTRIGIAALQSAKSDTEGTLRDLVNIWKADPGFLREILPLLREEITDEQREKLLSLVKNRQTGEEIPAGLEAAMESQLQQDEPSLPALSEERSKNPESVHEPMPATLKDSERFYFSGQYGKCSESLKGRLNGLPSNSLGLLTSCAFYAGDYKTASLAARRLAANPATRPAGLYWESKADQKLAVAALARAGEIDGDSPRMHILLGDVYRQKRKWDASEKEYKRALTLEPKSQSARLGLAISLFADGKNDEAYAEDKTLLENNPEDPEVNMLAGEILVQRNLYAEAEPYLNRSRGAKPEFMPRLHALLGEVYSASDRIPEALVEFRLGLVNDVDGSIHYRIARLYQKIGDKTAADEAFRVSKQLRKQWDDRASIALQQSGTDTSEK